MKAPRKQKMNQIKLTTFFITGLFAFSLQADTLTELNNCAVKKDSLERLVCYDNTVKSLNRDGAMNKPLAIRPTEPKGTKENIATRPSVTKPVVVQQKQKNVQEFGEEHLIKSEDSIDEVFFTVKSVKKIGRNKLSITFENGQVWRQSDDNYIKISSGDRAKLSKGMLGVIYLKTENQNRRIKVKRKK